MIEFKIRSLILLRKKRISGFTLIELSVVMALLAVISTMVVSFTLLITRSVSRITDKKAFNEELYYIENVLLYPWLNEFDNQDTIMLGAVISVSDYQFEGTEKGSDVAAFYNGKQYKFMFDGSKESDTYRTFTAQFSDGEVKTYQCKYITGMKVEVDRRPDAVYKTDYYYSVTISFNYKLSSDEDAEPETIVRVKALRTTR